MFQVPVGDCFILIQDDCDLSSVAESSTTGDAPKIVFIQIDDMPSEPLLSGRLSSECRGEGLTINVDDSAPPRDDSASPVPDTPTLLSLGQAMATADAVRGSLTFLPMEEEVEEAMAIEEDEEQPSNLTTRARSPCSSMPLLMSADDDDDDTLMGSSDESVRVDSD